MMKMRLFVTAALMLLTAGCEGLLGGEEAVRVPLQPVADGGYAPVRILLKPEMNTVAFNLHADFVWGKRDEAGLWNSYRATLKSGGKVIHEQEFQVNSPESSNATQSSPPPASLLQPMMRIDLSKEDEYEFTIASLKPAAVKLNAPHLVVRVNTRRL